MFINLDLTLIRISLTFSLHPNIQLGLSCLNSLGEGEDKRT